VSDATYTLLFIDDHPLYCEGLAYALAHGMQELRVLTVRNGAEALAVLETHDVDLVLSDYRLPGDDGISVLRRVASAHPSAALGLLCADLSPGLVEKAAALGAVACLSKDRDMASMTCVLRSLFDGRTVFDVEPPDTAGNGISEHRLRIIRLAAQGLSNKQVARELGISERTVKDHWSVILARLGAGNRIQAIQLARAQGLIDTH
jgi:DNA-binding NarL/FixJ family response regulator